MDFSLNKEECHTIKTLDSQKLAKKQIFGQGFLISDHAAAKLKIAEQKAIEQKQKPKREAITFELSNRERQIIEELNKYNK